MSTGRPTAPRWQALSGPLSLCRSGPGGDDRTKRGNGGSVGTGVERASQNDVMELVCDVPGTSTLATASCLATLRRHTTLPPSTADPRRILARHPRPRAAGPWMCRGNPVRSVAIGSGGWQVLHDWRSGAGVHPKLDDVWAAAMAHRFEEPAGGVHRGQVNFGVQDGPSCRAFPARILPVGSMITLLPASTQPSSPSSATHRRSR